MKQWNVFLTIIFALIVAIFAVINVNAVEVNYLFGTAKWPLILVILVSVLMGGIIIGTTGIVRVYSLKRNIKSMEKENKTLKDFIEKSNLSGNVEDSQSEKE